MTILIPPVQAALWLGAQQALASVGGRRRPGPVACLAGAALAGVAAAIGVSALARFAERDTTWHPWDPESSRALVTDGPNAVSRNPMYGAMALGLVGTGLLSGRPWTAVVAAGLPVSLSGQVSREEEALARVFGPAWQAYAERVPRWLGRRRG